MPVDRPQQKEDAGGGESPLGDQDQPATVEPVGPGSAPDREYGQRSDLHQTHEPEGEGRVGQKVYLYGQGHRGDLAAGEGDQLAERQQAEGPRLAKGRDVDGKLAHGRPGPREARDRVTLGILLRHWLAIGVHGDDPSACANVDCGGRIRHG
jgi:hypothetical protein